MKTNIVVFILGIMLILSGCEKKESIESIYRDAEKMEGDILKTANSIDKYRLSYEKILLEAPESKFAPLACYKLGKLNEIFGHYQDAIDYYQKLLMLYPENPICADGLFNVAQIYHLRLNKSDEAITAYTQLVHLYSDETAAKHGLLKLGQLQSEQEHWEDAVYNFQKFVAKYHDQSICDHIYFRMGDILQHKLNEPTRANEMYKTVLEKYPNSSWVIYCQERVAELTQGGYQNEK